MKKKQNMPKQTKEDAEREKQLFIPYESILIARKEALIELPLEKYDDTTPVFITEKIHGVNISIIIDFKHKGILLGKRNSLVSMLIPFAEEIPELQSYFIESFYTNNFVFAISSLWKKILEIGI